MISFAQNLEDVLIARFFRGDEPQMYVDVGAAHHSYHSVTKHFYDSGWRGINIEPRTHLWELLEANRPEDRNIQCGVSDITGNMTFFEVTSPTFTGTDAGGLSTLDANKIDNYKAQGYVVREKKLAIRTLSELFLEHGIQDLGFLKIDVEGFEYQVVRGLDLAQWRPRLIVAECTTPMTDILCDDQLHECLNGQRYLSAFYDGLNRFYVREEDSDRLPRLATPANVSDGYVLAEEIELRIKVDALNNQIAALEAKYATAEASNSAQRDFILQLEEEVRQLRSANSRLSEKRQWPLFGRMIENIGLKKSAIDRHCEIKSEESKKAA